MITVAEVDQWLSAWIAHQWAQLPAQRTDAGRAACEGQVSVDDTWQVSVRVETMRVQDTTCESTLEQWRGNAARGPRQPIGHD